LGPGSMVDPLPTFNFVEASQPGWWIKYWTQIVNVLTLQ
jgi:hypothetical protein